MAKPSVEETQAEAAVAWQRGDQAFVLRLESARLSDRDLNDHLNAALAVGWQHATGSVAVGQLGATIYLFTLVRPAAPTGPPAW